MQESRKATRKKKQLVLGKRCGGRPAALGHEAADARTYAHDWQIDYLKEDSCHASGDHATAFAQYGKMRDALKLLRSWAGVHQFQKAGVELTELVLSLIHI